MAQVMGRTRIASVVAAALISLAGTVGIAQAQPGRGGPGGPGGPGGDWMAPPITQADLNRYAKILNLTPEQKEAAKALVEGSEKEFQAQAEKMREQMRAMRDQGPPPGGPGGGAGFEEMRKRMDEARANREKSEEAIIADIKSILTPEQEALWPKVERARRRDMVGRQGMMSGERVDLMKLSESANWPEDVKAKVAPVLERYEVDLDRVLQQREQTYRTNMREMREKMRQGDMEGANKLMDEGRKVSQRVRDLNRSFAREIDGLLPEDQRATFASSVKTASYPRIYRQPLAERQLSAAAKIAGITDAQKGDLTSLQESFSKELSGLRDKMVAASDQMENNATIQSFMGRDRDEGPMGELNRERRELDRSTLDKLKKILTADQAEKLPKAGDDDNDDDGPWRGGGGGERRREQRRGRV